MKILRNILLGFGILTLFTSSCMSDNTATPLFLIIKHTGISLSCFMGAYVAEFIACCRK